MKSFVEKHGKWRGGVVSKLAAKAKASPGKGARRRAAPSRVVGPQGPRRPIKWSAPPCAIGKRMT